MANPKFTGYWILSRAITEADNAATVGAIEVPAQTFVSKVAAIVTEAFGTDGTSQIDVGDGDDPDGWIDNSQLSAGVAGGYTGTGGDAAYTAKQGKYYITADTIDVYVSSETGGSMQVIAHLLPIADLV